MAKQKNEAQKAEEFLQAELNDFVKSVNKEQGFDMMAFNSGGASEVKMHVPTGALELDIRLGGGFPVGRIVELFGAKGSGKSTLGDSLIVEAQKAGGVGIKIDSEHTHDPARFAQMGGSSSQLILIQPRTLEEALRFMVASVKKVRTKIKRKMLVPIDRPVVIFWDTLHASRTEAEVFGGDEGEFNYEKVEGLQPKVRLLQRWFPYIAPFLPRNNVLFVIANQMIANISPYGGAQTTTGGNVMAHYPTLRCRMSGERDEYEESGGPVGTPSTIYVQKNKLYGEQFDVRFAIRYDTGIDPDTTNLWWLQSNHLLPKKGGWHKFGYADVVHSFQPKSYREQLADKVPRLSEVLAAMVSKADLWEKVDIDGEQQWMFPSIEAVVVEDLPEEEEISEVVVGE